jgi:CubicO group peptidase (beta-lactamase class C family)
VIEIHGSCEPQFEKVREVFARSFDRPDGKSEVGAAVALWREGELAVDLWAGSADAAKTRPWQRDTIANVYSTTKGMTALCALRLAERGTLDLDAPVARYWPEFAANGKAAIPVRWLLTHQAGLAGVREKLPDEALFDWRAVCDALAAQAPWWEPGTKHGYHAVTFGHLVGEVVRRVDGRTLGNFFREELAEPLRLDFHIGVPEAALARCAEMIPTPVAPGEKDALATFATQADDSVTSAAFNNPRQRRGVVNTSAWRRAELPAANGHGDARSLAKVYGILAARGEHDGVRVLSPDWTRRARTEQVFGRDAVLMGMPTRFGLGFMLHHDAMPLGPNKSSFGHPGAGGSIAFADPDAGIGFAYVMNQMQAGIAGDPRGYRLIRAAYAGLG